jgi:TonB family protein
MPSSLGLHVLLLVLLRLMPPVKVPVSESVIQVRIVDTSSVEADVPILPPQRPSVQPPQPFLPTRTLASLPRPHQPTAAPIYHPTPLTPAGEVRGNTPMRPGAPGPRSTETNLTAGLPQFLGRSHTGSGDGLPGVPNGSVERPGALADKPAGDSSPLFGSGGAPAGPGVGTGRGSSTVIGTAGSTRGIRPGAGSGSRGGSGTSGGAPGGPPRVGGGGGSVPGGMGGALPGLMTGGSGGNAGIGNWADRPGGGGGIGPAGPAAVGTGGPGPGGSGGSGGNGGTGYGGSGLPGATGTANGLRPGVGGNGGRGGGHSATGTGSPLPGPGGGYGHGIGGSGTERVVGDLPAGSGTGTGSGPGNWADRPGGGGGIGLGGSDPAVGSPNYRAAAIGGPSPNYPSLAAKEGLHGTVILAVTIGSDGSVSRISILQRSQADVLDNEALRTAKQWKFHSGMSNGKVVGGTVKLQVTFDKGKAPAIREIS